MQVHLSIGDNRRFELREALLIYTGNRQSFITRHEVVHQELGPPSLGPAQPLTNAFIDSLLRSMRQDTDAEILPDHVLAKGDRSIVWWTPARRRQMFYTNAQDKACELNGKTFPQPPLVWRVSRGTLAVRALSDNKRPNATTKLAFAPFWNLSHTGQVCLGSMRCPESACVAGIREWEDGFYESAFTHGNVSRITKHSGGFEAMWSGLAGKRKAFPAKYLIKLPETLAQFVRGERT
jgi:PRTRC genetic system protein B